MSRLGEWSMQALRVRAEAQAKAAPDHGLADPEDLRLSIGGVRRAREILQQEPLRSRIAREIFPGPDKVSDADLAEHAKRFVKTVYHPVGTCRIGVDEQAVVDPQLRVRGIDGLRVVDASVMPTLPGGNTNAPTIMIAERAADLIQAV